MIGQIIRDLRQNRGDSLRSLAQKLDYSHGTLGKVERGEIKPSIELLRKIAAEYDMPLNYFITEEDTHKEDLRSFGIEWVKFAEEVEEKKLTLDELRAVIEIIEKYKNKE